MQDLRFTTTEVVKMAYESGLDLDHERLRLWHRQGYGPGPAGVGHGIVRQYSLDDFLYLAGLTVASYRIPHLAGAIEHARTIAARLAEQWGASGDSPEERWVLLGSSGGCKLLPYTDELVGRAARGPLVVNVTQLVFELQARVEDCLARREGKSSAW